ncbi:NAD-dependent epimerase/dehydratase family protein [Propionibacteriaceae bacterium Y1685]|uniref:NAD-dependent epimerase/dehydratase family protein n=1 Tax=Microlunatus sp. Y1700 TaxID=3418487 RepID=UPI003B79FF99
MRVLLVDIPEILLPGLRRALGHHEVTISTEDLLDPEGRHARDFDVVVHGLPEASSSSPDILRATLGTWNLLGSLTGPTRYVLLSTMRQFAGYDSGWTIDEEWYPRPDAEELSSHLAELLSREQSRRFDVTTWVLRLDTVIGADEFDAGPIQPDWLHVDDAVAAIVAAVDSDHERGWRPVHIVRGDGRRPLGHAGHLLGWQPTHTLPGTRHDQPRWPATPGPLDDLPVPRRLTLYGAGGPLGAAAVSELINRPHLRVTDAEPVSVTSARKPQTPGAPLPSPVPPPHEEQLVDVTDAEAVRRAAVDADCLVNLSVIRHDPVKAFTVNVLGALHVVRAALAEGVSRIVHTGPTLSVGEFPYGHVEDREVTTHVPHRPGSWVYANAKMLGQEIVRIFADQHRLAAPVVLFCQFFVPGLTRPVHPFALSWADTGRVLAAACDVTTLPEPSPVINALAPAPHGSWSTRELEQVLGFVATDSGEQSWYR